MASKWWVASAALLTLLAGCLEDAPGADPQPVPDDPAPADGNQTAPPATNATVNAAPDATLEASATNGTAPLNVTLTLGGSDPDGDNLTWTLTVGNDTFDGSALPATVNVTLEAGNHTVTLVVSDGNATGDASLVITVEAAEVVEAVGDGMCHRPDATAAGDIYVLDEGGTWIFMESNGVDGLQVGNTHPTGEDGGGVGFAKPDWAGCVDGDLMLV